jgi:Zn ribbon nucleic-acid-binding protein
MKKIKKVRLYCPFCKRCIRWIENDGCGVYVECLKCGYVTDIEYFKTPEEIAEQERIDREWEEKRKNMPPRKPITLDDFDKAMKEVYLPTFKKELMYKKNTQGG